MLVGSARKGGAGSGVVARTGRSGASRTAVNLLHSAPENELPSPDAPPDAAASYQRALDAGVTFGEVPPRNFDLCLDALLGLGAVVREPEGRMADWIHQMNTGTAPVIMIAEKAADMIKASAV